jgi:hypothetical protein
MNLFFLFRKIKFNFYLFYFRKELHILLKIFKIKKIKSLMNLVNLIEFIFKK